MLDAIGETLPLAVAIALSPLAIASVVLMLLSSRPRAASIAFLLGFAVAVAAVSTVGFLLASVLPHGDDDSSLSAPFLLLALGIVAIVLAVRQWRKRPEPGDELELPGWIAKVESITTPSAFVLGAFFGGLKPKNLLLSIGLGVSLEATGVSSGEAAIALGAVVLIAASPLLVPVIISLVALERISASLDRLRDWMVRHNSALVGAILLLVGVLLIGKAVSGLGA
ncbi:GAP family protein [Microcella sp.]|uniref:GAP family protein n=1 Tax=Microcella sp. TaxID=1913979 RepID=UPI003F6E90B8